MYSHTSVDQTKASGFQRERETIVRIKLKNLAF